MFRTAECGRTVSRKAFEVEQTSTRFAPWTLVEANCKRHARLKVLDTVADHIERALAGKPPRIV